MSLTTGLKNFLKSETSTGIILSVCVVIACIIVNSPFNCFYKQLLSILVPINLDFLVGGSEQMSLKLWINDGFMAVFFLLVGLELKREVLLGELSSISRMFLPVAGAIGGVLMPALIYSNLNYGNDLYLKGWAIPTATDIAFAIAVVNLFGKKISNSLKIFLVALAVIDDLIAILIIALFYSHEISMIYLDLTIITIACLLILNRLKISSLWPYLLCGIILWFVVLKSGIHATIAGVLLAMFIPIYNKKTRTSPLQILENHLHRPVNYLILPLFALANAGINFFGITLSDFINPLVLGIAISLFLGKQLGITLIVFILTKLKLIHFLKNVTWMEFYGISILAGIGFTMSLFIGGLAFAANPSLSNHITLGVILGSIASITYGCLILLLAIHLKNHKPLPH